MKKVVLYFLLGIILNGFISLFFIPFSLAVGPRLLLAAKYENEQKPFWLMLASFSGSVIGFTIAIFVVVGEINPIDLGIWSTSYAIIVYIISALSPFFVLK